MTKKQNAKYEKQKHKWLSEVAPGEQDWGADSWNNYMPF